MLADQKNGMDKNGGTDCDNRIHRLKGIVIYTALIIFVAATLLAGFNAASGASGKNPARSAVRKVKAPVADKVKLELYVMSQCPYGVETENAIAPVLKKLSGRLDFSLNYIAETNSDGSCNSLHGQSEVDGDIIQLCAIKYEPQKYMDMIVKMNQKMEGIPSNWSEAAAQLNMNTNLIQSCFSGDEGKQLLRDSAAKSKAANATASPTIIINGKLYNGNRGEDDLLRAVCDAYSNKPAVCPAALKPKKGKKLTAIVLSDKRCGEKCNITHIRELLKGDFPGIIFKDVDYSSKEGKKLYQETEFKKLPAIFFDEKVKTGGGYANVKKYLSKAGPYYSLDVASTFDPRLEICDNGIDDDGNGLIDCDDPTCKNAVNCRPENKGLLEVYIASADPFGKKAIEILNEVAEKMKDKMNYNVHYIAGESNGNIISSRGQFEVDEDMYQLCAKKVSSTDWFKFVTCRSKKGAKANDRSICAKASGIDMEQINACFTNKENEILLRDDMQSGLLLDIKASPTWVVNNKYVFNALDTPSVMSNFLYYNSQIDTNNLADVAEKATDFTLNDIYSNKVALSGFKGKKVLAIFWGSKCMPCKEELPELEKLYQENKDIVILAINLGERLEWIRNFVESNKYHFTVLLDRDTIVGSLYSVDATPYIFFINSDGTFFKKNKGRMERKDIDETIKNMK